MIYLDHAATTPVAPEVLEAMLPYFTRVYANPSNVHRPSLEARRALDQARQGVAGHLGARQASEIVFTASGTEADNLAVLGLARAHREHGDHVVTTRIEHHAVLHACDQLEREGFRVTRLPVDEWGRVDPQAVLEACGAGTVLVSVMLANNEIGSLQPVAEIAELLRGRGILLHSDAVQAVGHIPVDVGQLGVDALSLSAHKFHGPKGVGALYLKTGIRVEPLLFGGGQERGLRSGTENVPGVVGLARALELACAGREERAERLRALRNRLVERVLGELPDAHLTGHPELRLPGTASFVFEGAEGESLLLQLDRKGICVSTGSACSNATLEPSHVLKALGLPQQLAHGSLRLTLGRENTVEEVDQVAQALVEAVRRLRSLAPRLRN